MNDFSEKLVEIEYLIGRADGIARLLELTHDSDEEVRFRAIEALEEVYPSKEILSRVRECTSDADELVRVASIEALGNWKDKSSTEKLYLALSDESSLVRSAAITSIGQIGRKDSTWVLEKKFEQSEHVEKVSAGVALYSFGKKKYLQKVLELLDSDDYHTRCAVANMISEFVKPEDVKSTLLVFKKALLKEKTKSVTSSLKKAIGEIWDG